MKKRVAFILIFALCMGMIFPYVPSVMKAEEDEEKFERITMRELYGNKNSMTAEQGMTVTISSAAEMDMWMRYSYDEKVKNPSLSGVTVELLQDIRYAPCTFSYDKSSGRFGFYAYGELKGTYDADKDEYYSDFISENGTKGEEYHYGWSFAYIYGQTGEFWQSINNFAGTFEGNNHCIAGMWENAISQHDKYGILFDELDGCVRNLKLSQCYGGKSSGMSECNGAICGTLRGRIENCQTSDIYIAGENGVVGGLVGEIQERGTITGCSAETYIAGNDWETGGLVGRICTNRNVEIEGNYTSGLVKLSKNSSNVVGGIVGELAPSTDGYSGVHGRIVNCVSEVEIRQDEIGLLPSTCAGIVGTCAQGEWSIVNCENKGIISGGEATGGVIGYARSVFIDQCRNAGSVTGCGSVGGIVGEATYALIVNTENTGDVSWELGEDCVGSNVKRAGGMGGSISYPILYNSFCSGNVITSDNKVYAGGIIGVYSRISMSNLCAYASVPPRETDNILLGNGTAAIEMEDIYYPGQDVDSQCDALNDWVRTKGEIEYSYVYMDGEGGTFVCKEWKREGDAPRLQLEDSQKPEKPEKIILPELTPPPTQTPKPSVTATPTPVPTPTSSALLTAPPTITPTQTPTVIPAFTPAPTPKTATEKPMPPVVSAVGGVKIKAKKNATLTVKWKPVSGATGYSVYRSSKKKSGYREISGVLAGKEKWCDRSVKERHTYYYRVAAYRLVGGRKVYGVNSNPRKVTVKLRAPTISMKKKKSGSGQRYIQIKIKKNRASQVELWVKRGKKPFRRVKLHGVEKRKKTNTINLRYKPEGKRLYIRARIIQKKKKKRYKSYYSKTKRIRI